MWEGGVAAVAPHDPNQVRPTAPRWTGPISPLSGRPDSPLQCLHHKANAAARQMGSWRAAKARIRSG